MTDTISRTSPRRASRRRAPAGVPWTALTRLVILIGTVARLPQLGHSLNEMFAFRQTQTAMLVRSYAESGIDLRHSPLPLFGLGSDVPLELPLVQAVAALLARTGLDPSTALRTVGLAGFVVTGLLLAGLVTRWHGPRVALIAVLVLQFAPFGLAWGAAGLIEFPAVALALGTVALVERWFRGAAWWVLLPAGALSAVAFAVKATTAPLWCLLVGAAGLAVLHRDGLRRAAPRVLAGWAVVAVPGLAAAAAWTSYADGVKERSPLTLFLTSQALTDWNFGTLTQRADLGNYEVIMSRVLGEITGPFGVVLLVASVLALARGEAGERMMAAGWLATALAGPAIFFNLYVVHNYYLCAIFPALAVLVALGADRLISLVGRTPVRAVVVGVVAATLVASSGVSALGRTDLAQWRKDSPLPGDSAAILSGVPAGEAVVYVGCDWDPTVPFYADRPALMLRTPEIAQAYWAGDLQASVPDPRDYKWLYNCAQLKGLKPYLAPGVRLNPSGIFLLYRLRFGEALRAEE